MYMMYSRLIIVTPHMYYPCHADVYKTCMGKTDMGVSRAIKAGFKY